MTPQTLKDAAKIVETLEKELEAVPYNKKIGDNIQIEDDTIYFRIVGQPCDYQAWEEYKAWEETRFCLRSIISRLEKQFFNFDFKHMETYIKIEPKKH